MRLRYTSPALGDLASIFDYIAANSPQGARRVQRRIQEAVRLLTIHPVIGVRTEDPTIRRLTAHPYPFVIFYEITADEVLIHAVRHGARDPSGMPGGT